MGPWNLHFLNPLPDAADVCGLKTAGQEALKRKEHGSLGPGILGPQVRHFSRHYQDPARLENEASPRQAECALANSLETSRDMGSHLSKFLDCHFITH